MALNRYLILGLTFLIALCLTLFVTLAWGVHLALGEYTQEYQVSFERVQGIREGDKVLVKGNQQGIVGAVVKDAEDPDRLKVTLRMLAGTFKDKDDLRHFTFTVRNENLFGVKFIDVEPLRAIPAERFLDFVREERDEKTDTQTALVLGLKPELRDTLGLDRDSKLEFGGTLIALADGPPFSDEGGARLVRFKPLSRATELENPARYRYLFEPGGVDDAAGAGVQVFTPKQARQIGALPDTVRTASEPNIGEVLQRFEQALLEFQIVGAKLNDPDSGMLGKVVSDPDMAMKLENIGASLETTMQDVQDIAANLKDATAKDAGGPVARLLHDQQLGEDLKTTVSDVKTLADNLKRATDEKEGEGVVATLLWDKQLSDDLKEIGGNLRQVSAKLTQTRGSTLGMLINDDEIGRMLKATMKNLNASVEDIREHAPVVTFTGVLFQAFQ